ncbi:AhpC/TSA family protein [Mucilaginibacter limnophilus]|uniref:AhpC/TSA family protein n=1 Tax=Mucilaginibacter limnophilus TaxID=1932778 RepID=A0A3S2V2N4_9SPHI|nr:TlpA disulfide reductase family protein [Mucilaginibacter limnophilus]RVU01673.1 AhpC/TSA family protein [Mucilaginibacter limnophilus]
MKHRLILIMLIVCVFVPNTFAQKSKGFVINATIHGLPDKTLVRLISLDEQIVLDSAYSVNGKLTFKGSVTEPQVCWIMCDKGYATIMVENLPMRFESPIDKMNIMYVATAGKEQAVVNKLSKLQYGLNLQADSIYSKIQNNQYKDKDERNLLADKFNRMQDSLMVIYVNVGKRNINSYFGLDIVYRNRKSIPHDTLVHLYETMPAKIRSTGKGRNIKMFLYSTLAEKGKPMIDFEVKTIEGKSFKLSSLKGKNIYLTFGSVGCGPCRTENKALAANYAKLSPYVELVSFSLDKNLDDWRRMAKEDGIVWNNISDMKGEGEVKLLYNVQSIPAAFLINKEGIIVERYDGYDDELVSSIEKKVKEM